MPTLQEYHMTSLLNTTGSKIFCPLQYTHNVNFSTKINHMIV